MSSNLTISINQKNADEFKEVFKKDFDLDENIIISNIKEVFHEKFDLDGSIAIFNVKDCSSFDAHEKLKDMKMAHVIKSKSGDNPNSMRMCWRPGHECLEIEFDANDIPVIAGADGKITFGPLKLANTFTRELKEVLKEIS